LDSVLSTVNSLTQIANPILSAATISLPATNVVIQGFLAAVLPTVTNAGSMRIFPPGTLLDTLQYATGRLQAVVDGTTWDVLAGMLQATGAGTLYVYNYYSGTGPAEFPSLFGYLPVVQNVIRRLRNRQPTGHRSRFPIRTDTAPATQATSTRSRSRSRHTANTSDAVRDETPVIPPYDVAGNNTRSDDAELRVGLLDQPREVSPALVLVPHNRLPDKEL
jgi:hypothetical protein